MSWSENVSHRIQQKLGIAADSPDVADPGRRRFLKAAVGAGLIYFGSHELTPRVVPLIELLTPREFRDEPVVRSTTVYSDRALKGTAVFGIGDSMINRRGNSPVTLAVNEVNDSFGSGWYPVMFAQEGEDMEAILRQQQSAAKWMLPRLDIDIMCSGGGNDIIDRTLVDPVMKAKVDRLLENPFSLEAFTVAREVHESLELFTEKFYRFLHNFKTLRQQGASINRVVMESVTNMGYVNVHDESFKFTDTPLPKNDGDLAKYIGANISSRLVGGMVDAAKRLGPDPGFDILLINNYDSTDLRDIHLNDTGRRKAVRQQFSRSYSQFGGRRLSFTQAM